MNRNPRFVRWLRRIISTIVTISVFFAAFSGGLFLFLHGDVLRAAIALIIVIVGLAASRLLWV
ncbi:MAG TPA: hypothetical protein ENH51_00840 [Euryarchaeota archaeon]|nr:hypothetical protein [Euryarchaeota archaeon]